MRTKIKKKAGKTPDPAAPVTSDHILLNPEDWKDPKGRKIIGEYHKDIHADRETEKMMDEKKQAPKKVEETDVKTHKTLIRHIIDLSTIELMAYTLSRALFRQGVKVPLYMKGVVDMDIAVKDTDVILNTNDVSFEPPPLQIWHIVFSYKGKPILEYGRGVKNTMKIHHCRALIFLISMWIGARKRRKACEKATLDACMDLAKNPPEKMEKIPGKDS